MGRSQESVSNTNTTDRKTALAATRISQLIANEPAETDRLEIRFKNHHADIGGFLRTVGAAVVEGLPDAEGWAVDWGATKDASMRPLEFNGYGNPGFGRLWDKAVLVLARRTAEVHYLPAVQPEPAEIKGVAYG